MSKTDVAVLYHLLLGMSEQEVRSLNGGNLWWLPDLSTLTVLQAINAIGSALQAFRTLDRRTYCIAWIYCRLAELQLIRCWHSYSLSPCAAVLTGDFRLEESLASALDYPGGHTTHAKIDGDEGVYACIMTTKPTRATSEHDVICLCMPRSLPHLFASVPPFTESRFDAALEAVLRVRPAEIYDGYCIEMRNVFANARLMAASSSTDAEQRQRSCNWSPSPPTYVHRMSPTNRDGSNGT
ncbi:uncharacterized protein LOC125940063 [Dermacentor silvarum]|uniref:uncharacterized protein LOC125940063 n=1 Tax=Dermacentor silvarum TaxID=543639 RepID=UPI0021013E60|nr:uncharacterized protein LOC125940063 [Dermacentor silvarum]